VSADAGEVTKSAARTDAAASIFIAKSLRSLLLGVTTPVNTAVFPKVMRPKPMENMPDA
jgi:hypothetical protein